MIRGIHHIAIITEDLQKMTDFYCGLLGAEIAFESHWEPGSPKIDAILGVPGTSADLRMVRLGNAYIELFKFHVPETVPPTERPDLWEKGLRHICLDVVDVAGEVERLTAAGVQFDGVLTSARMARTVYGRDPEGNILEFQEILVDDAPFRFPLDIVTDR